MASRSIIYRPPPSLSRGNLAFFLTTERALYTAPWAVAFREQNYSLLTNFLQCQYPAAFLRKRYAQRLPLNFAPGNPMLGTSNTTRSSAKKTASTTATRWFCLPKRAWRQACGPPVPHQTHHRPQVAASLETGLLGMPPSALQSSRPLQDFHQPDAARAGGDPQSYTGGLAKHRAAQD